MTDPLSTLLHDTAQRVPAALHPAAELRHQAKQHKRARRAGGGAAAATLMAAAFVVGGGLPDGQNRATELPATQPPINRTSLLILDELPGEVPFIHDPVTWQLAAAGEGEDALVAGPCQPRAVADLRPDRLWHAHYTADIGNEGLQARQVTAQFDTDERAGRAMEAVDAWFDDCALAVVARWPDVAVEGGRARLLDYYSKQDARSHIVSYGVNGNAITLFSYSRKTPGPVGEATLAERAPMNTTMGFALQRLSGARTIAVNVIPSDFRFVGETRDPSRLLGSRWAFYGCDYRDLRASDANRIGLLKADDDASSDAMLTRQLAVYRDARSARAAAQELITQTSDCASTQKYGDSDSAVPAVRWFNESPTGSGELHLAWMPNPEEGESANVPGHAVAIFQRGSAVLVAWGLLSGVDAPESTLTAAEAKTQTLEMVEKAVRDNIEAACRVAGDCD